MERGSKILNKFNTLLASSLLSEVDGGVQITPQGTLGIYNFSVKVMPLFLKNLKLLMLVKCSAPYPALP